MINPLRYLTGPFRPRISVYNGVAVRDKPFWHPIHTQPMHKDELWRATLSAVEPGDSVTFVGGGLGIVPVKAAEYGCDVTVIEAAKEQVERLEETSTLNRTPLRIVHGLVENGRDIYGDATEARHIETAELDGDVLVLDCEGAEVDILPAAQFARVVVETHPQCGAPTDAVEELLEGDVIHFETARHRGDFLVQQ